MTPPLVSVVMPVFNGERFVMHAVRSILSQSFTDLELIVIDDGSTDYTKVLLNRVSDERLRLFSRENRGISESLNEAIALSRGRFIARMDADDISLSDRIQKQVAYMQDNPSVDILGGQAYLIDEKGKSIGQARKPCKTIAVNSYAKYNCPVIHPTYMVRKTVYMFLKGYRRLPVEDYDFLLRAIESGFTIENLPDFLLEYRLSPTGLSMGNPYATMVFTSIIQKMHRVRLRNLSEEELYSKTLSLSPKAGVVFAVAYKLRERLIHHKMKSSAGGKIILSLGLVFISLMHIRIFKSSLYIFIASTIARREKN